ncbi:putative polysaccharide deacetylase protein [Neofusicoccum parvum UCRNP2]|uniref:Putative polysaccharide deacetylase protein n=1 Tax=Botryosphaeria parva (strain UCR-NP2) TaxID=1287680 RepID=R1GCH5_BOTPV|nr:putative polysaccharide deacetylase protein [Neofusicoccum parvum UCRNP2]
MTNESGLRVWRIICAAFLCASLVHLSISRSKSPDLFPHYQNPRHLVARKCQVPGLAALTFDDFPNERIDELLELLGSWNATATFFVNGPYDPRDSVLQEELLGPRLKKIHRLGHQIASHTYDHINLNTADQHAFSATMARFDTWLGGLLGGGIAGPRYMRAPVVGWGFDTEDWKHHTAQTVHRAVRRVHDHAAQLQARQIVDLTADIVLMHGFHNTTVTTVAPAVLEALGAVGYRFVSVAECLGHPAENWYRRREHGA